LRGGVVFDFDLTLVDSAKGIWGTLSALAEEKGLRRPDLPEVKRTIGWALTDAMRSFWGNGPVEEEWLPRYREIFEESHYAGVLPFAEVVPALTRLRSRGIALAVASNRLNPVSIVKAAGLEKYFSVIAGIEGINPKPAPDVVLKALDEMGVAPKQAMYVGDSDIDMETARRAGVLAVGVTTGNHDAAALRRSGADVVISTLEELPELLEELK
jgi:phosphoglycolate phosphatase